MEEDRSLGAGGDSSSRVASTCEKHGERTRFTVELRPGETTIVSWKKLMRDVPKSDNPVPPTSNVVAVNSVPQPPATGAHPALESRLAPGQPASNEVKDATAPNRFNAVIEKIERLYMGKDSSDDEDLGDNPDDDQYDTEDSFIDDAELDEYFEVDKVKTKHDGFFVNRGKLESLDPSLSPNQHSSKRRREMVKTTEQSNSGRALNKNNKLGRKRTGKMVRSLENDSFPASVAPSGTNPQNIDYSGVRSHEKGGSGHIKPQSKKANSGVQPEVSLQYREKNDNRELIDLNVAATKHPVKTSLVHKREGSSFRSKSSMLEKAIRELEKMVAESRPPTADLRDADAHSQAVKRRLSQGIKHKLAKVARLAQVSHGKVSMELVSRLMGILGHLINVRTLKRNLKMMISSSLTVSQEKHEKFQRIKGEVVEMVRTHAPLLTNKAPVQQSEGANDFQESCHEEKRVTKVKYMMDPALEDKICDLYDIFVDGLDEDVAPQARKLYSELAELWPKGLMDNHGIKRAICHSKERRRALHEKKKEQDIIKRKKVLATKMEDSVQAESTSAVHPGYVQELGSAEGCIMNAHNRFTPSAATATPTSNLPSAAPSVPISSNVQNFERSKDEKLKGAASSSYVEIRASDGTLVKKKVKRKSDTDLAGIHARPEKLSVRGDDKQKSHKQQVAGPLICDTLQKSSDQSVPKFEQLM